MRFLLRALCSLLIASWFAPLGYTDERADIGSVPDVQTLVDTPTCDMMPGERPLLAADYIEHTRFCLVVTPYGYTFDQALENVFLDRVNEVREAAGRCASDDQARAGECGALSFT